MSLEPGARLGPYEIVALVGAGGMGEVYKARDTRLGRTVAIKVLPPGAAASPERRRRFEQEARAVSSLNHPHICTSHDIGRDGETDYLVMEFVQGGLWLPDSPGGCSLGGRRSSTRPRWHRPCRKPTPRESFTGTSSRATSW